MSGCNDCNGSECGEHKIVQELYDMSVYKRFQDETLREKARAEARSVLAFHGLTRWDTWEEKWPAPNLEEQIVHVTAEIWTDAIQTALDKCKTVYIPWRVDPYYIDALLIMNSGNRLIVDPQTEIRLKPFSNTCMVRNRNPVMISPDAPLELSDPDTDIHIEGGIWSTLAFGGGDIVPRSEKWATSLWKAPPTRWMQLNIPVQTNGNDTTFLDRSEDPLTSHTGNVIWFSASE